MQSTSEQSHCVGGLCLSLLRCIGWMLGWLDESGRRCQELTEEAMCSGNAWTLICMLYEPACPNLLASIHALTCMRLGKVSAASAVQSISGGPNTRARLAALHKGALAHMLKGPCCAAHAPPLQVPPAATPLCDQGRGVGLLQRSPASAQQQPCADSGKRRLLQRCAGTTTCISAVCVAFLNRDCCGCTC